MHEVADVIHVGVFSVTGDLLVAADLLAGSTVHDLKRVVLEQCGVHLSQQRMFNHIGEILGNEEVLTSDTNAMSVSLAVVVTFTFTPDRIFDLETRENDINLSTSNNMRVAAEDTLASVEDIHTVAAACEPLSPYHGVFSAILQKHVGPDVNIGVAHVNVSGFVTEKPFLWTGRYFSGFGNFSWIGLHVPTIAEGDVLTLQRRHGQLLGAINGQCVMKDGCPILAENLGLSDDIYPVLGFHCDAGAEWQVLPAGDPRNYDVDWPESA